MRITSLEFALVPATEFDGMVSFLRDVLRIRLAEQGTPVTDPNFTKFARFELPDGFTMEVVEPTPSARETFVRPVLSMTVDDVAAAMSELKDADVELVSDLIRSDDGWAWIYVRAPDGSVYQLHGPANVQHNDLVVDGLDPLGDPFRP